MPRDMDVFVKQLKQLISEVDEEMAAEDAARQKRIDDANLRHVKLLSDVPVRVQVRRHKTDNHVVCDVGRFGWVRRAPEPAPSGKYWVYVEDLSPELSGDRSPTRFHQPLHLHPVEN